MAHEIPALGLKTSKMVPKTGKKSQNSIQTTHRHDANDFDKKKPRVPLNRANVIAQTPPRWLDNPERPNIRCKAPNLGPETSETTRQDLQQTSRNSESRLFGVTAHLQPASPIKTSRIALKTHTISSQEPPDDTRDPQLGPSDIQEGLQASNKPHNLQSKTQPLMLLTTLTHKPRVVQSQPP